MKITLGMIGLIVSCRLLAYEMFPFFVSFQVLIMVFKFILNQYEKADVQDVDSKFTLICKSEW